MNIHFPWSFDRRKRTAACPDEDHIREMIEQLLFTNPGERVMRPDLGCGIMQTVFAADSDQLAATLQMNIQAVLQRWLGDVIELRGLDVSHEDSILNVSLNYVVIRTGERRVDEFQRRNVA